jgi:hypothetical protein
MTATIISIASYLHPKLSTQEEPEDQVAHVACRALHAFWAEVARAIPARRGGAEAIELAELEPLARAVVRSWIYVNEGQEENNQLSTTRRPFVFHQQNLHTP